MLIVIQIAPPEIGVSAIRVIGVSVIKYFLLRNPQRYLFLQRICYAFFYNILFRFMLAGGACIYTPGF